MNKRLPASHLLRQFLLFFLTLIMLLTLLRAAYALWQVTRIEQPIAVFALFVQGLRFDVALGGLLSIGPLMMGTLLAVSEKTRVLARVLIVASLLAGLLLVLLAELMTPWFLQTRGLRPDLPMLLSIQAPMELMVTLFKAQTVPLALATLLCGLVLVAYWQRMDLSCFLKRRLSVSGAVLVIVFGGALCLMAVRSRLDPAQPSLSPLDARISTHTTINELAMNSAFKLLYSAFRQPIVEEMDIGLKSPLAPVPGGASR